MREHARVGLGPTSAARDQPIANPAFFPRFRPKRRCRLRAVVAIALVLFPRGEGRWGLQSRDARDGKRRQGERFWCFQVLAGSLGW